MKRDNPKVVTDAPTGQLVFELNRIGTVTDQRRKAWVVAIACGIAGLSVMLALPQCAASGQNPPSSTDPDYLPDGPGKAVVARTCLSCHTAKVATSKPGTEDEWAEEVNQMMARGAALSDEEVDQVVEYLAKHFGPPVTNNENAPSTAAAPLSPDKTEVSLRSDAPPPLASSPTTVNVNKASAGELQSSLGLSKQEAEAIVQYREQHGNFRTLQDLVSASGISLEKIKEKQKLITF